MATQPVTPPSNTPPPTTKPTLPPSTPLTPILAKLPTKDKNTSLILGVGILFLILIGGIAFLFYQNQQLRQNLPSLPSPTSSDLSQTTDDMDGWEVYTDPAFSFNYPPDMIIEPSSEPKVFYLTTSNFEPSGSSGYQVQITKITDDMPTINQYMQITPNTPEQANLDKQDSLSINNNQTVVRTYKDSWNVYKKYYIYSPEVAVILQGTGKNHTILDQILSTFQFTTKPTQDTSDNNSPTIVFLPPLSNNNRQSEQEAIRTKIINPFIDFQNDLDPNQTITSITIQDNSEESSKSQYPYSFTAIFENGSVTQILLRQTNGEIDWYEPTCMGCQLTPAYRQKYPEVAKIFDQTYGN